MADPMNPPSAAPVLGPLRLDAYYYSFDPTGCEAIDLVLSAVATAGKAYHHTESWGDDDVDAQRYPHFRGRSYVEFIQHAADDAAKAVAALTRQNAELEAVNRRTVTFVLEGLASINSAMRHGHEMAAGEAFAELRHAMKEWQARDSALEPEAK